jgi:hypothetical protein
MYMATGPHSLIFFYMTANIIELRNGYWNGCFMNCERLDQVCFNTLLYLVGFSAEFGLFRRIGTVRVSPML